MDNRSKFYDAYPNKAIRERAEQLGLNSPSLAKAINAASKERNPDVKEITAEAVRQWTCGYMQPRYDRLPDLMKALDCSLYYLFGMEDVPNADAQRIRDVTGLSEAAIACLMENKSSSNWLEFELINMLLENKFRNSLEFAFDAWCCHLDGAIEMVMGDSETKETETLDSIDEANTRLKDVPGNKIEYFVDLGKTIDYAYAWRYRLVRAFEKFLDSVEADIVNGEH